MSQQNYEQSYDVHFDLLVALREKAGITPETRHFWQSIQYSLRLFSLDQSGGTTNSFPSKES